MTKLREVLTNTYNFFVDEDDRRQGKFKIWYDNGYLHEYGSIKDNRLHGEYKRWGPNGQLLEHKFYENGWDITEKAWKYADNDVMFALVINIPRLPNEDDENGSL